MADGGGGDVGGGAAGSGPSGKPVNWNFQLDQKVDALATKINAEIQAKADKDRVEYGAYIYKDEQGNIKQSQLIPGTNFGVPGMLGSPTDFGFSTWDQVVGMIHSHPTFASTPNGEMKVTPESHYERPSPGQAGSTGAGDWFLPDFLVDNGASATDFRQYISFDGNVYEYDYYNNNNRGLSPTARSEQSVLATN